MKPNFNTEEPQAGEYMPCPDCGRRDICHECKERIEELVRECEPGNE